MRKLLGPAIVLSSAVVAAGALYGAESNRPDWAYAIPQGPGPQRAPEDGKLYGLPGLEKKYTLSEIRGVSDTDPTVITQPADWYPGDHPQMPPIVAHGDNARKIAACSLCHYPNGKGRTENAPPAGQPKDYIVRQLQAFRDGMRKSADPRKANTNRMISFAKAMTEEEINQAADYFSSMKWTPWIKVVETNTPPKSRSVVGMWMPYEGAEAGTMAIGERIIESPVDPHATETLRDPHSGFVAYVPVGAVEKGKEFVETGGNGKSLKCAICHGPDLHGLGSVPDIAGRSPAYMARQLYDIQVGARLGGMVELMKPVVANMTNADFVDVTAYLASLPAQSQSGGGQSAQK
jgi:cytochrome c553